MVFLESLEKRHKTTRLPPKISQYPCFVFFVVCLFLSKSDNELHVFPPNGIKYLNLILIKFQLVRQNFIKIFQRFTRNMLTFVVVGSFILITCKNKHNINAIFTCSGLVM